MAEKPDDIYERYPELKIPKVPPGIEYKEREWYNFPLPKSKISIVNYFRSEKSFKWYYAERGWIPPPEGLTSQEYAKLLYQQYVVLKNIGSEGRLKLYHQRIEEARKIKKFGRIINPESQFTAEEL